MHNQLHWEFSVLARAVAYQNLSDAAMHIGISQPQLSRIISKIETELNVTILDRSARRKSGWLPVALKISETYTRNERRLESEMQDLVSDTQVSTLRMAALEGFGFLGIQAANLMLTQTQIKSVELDIHDLDELERLFIKGDLDVIFTLREPSKRKYRYTHRIGYQNLAWHKTSDSTLVLSTFENSSKLYKKWDVQAEKIFVSNSLELRKQWLTKFKGAGILPADVLKDKPSKPSAASVSGAGSDESVYMIASEQLSPKVWEKIIKTNFKLQK